MHHKKIDIKKELEHLIKVCSSSDTPPEYCFLNDGSPIQCEHRDKPEKYPYIDMWGVTWKSFRYKCKRYK